MKTFEEIQKEIGSWALEQFKDNRSKDEGGWLEKCALGSLAPLLGMVEEIGELCHATIYRHQGRGYQDIVKYREAKEDALADLLIFACDYAEREGIALLPTLRRVWETVQKRRQEKWNEDKAKEKSPEPETGPVVRVSGAWPVTDSPKAAWPPCEVCGGESTYEVFDQSRDGTYRKVHYLCREHNRLPAVLPH